MAVDDATDAETDALPATTELSALDAADEACCEATPDAMAELTPDSAADAASDAAEVDTFALNVAELDAELLEAELESDEASAIAAPANGPATRAAVATRVTRRFIFWGIPSLRFGGRVAAHPSTPESAAPSTRRELCSDLGTLPGRQTRP